MSHDSEQSKLTPADLESQLHNLLANVLLEKLSDPDVTPGWATVARGFLNDNRVSGLDVETDKVSELAAKYGSLKLRHG
jgi:hypothetical protein